ncbi:MAG: hypothetical protein U1C71_04905, partial [archaeon]|nr:hypothetical protein [archaeon]
MPWFPMRWAGLILFLLLFAGLVAAQQQLQVNQVFIKNNNSTPLSNDPVNIPIAFGPGAMTVSQLPSVKVGTLPTQVQPTSYYSDGSVRTAVAWVLASMQAGQETIYTLSTGSSPNFTWAPGVEDLLRNRNNSSLRILVRDIKGGEYAVTLDVDGMGNCNAKGYATPKFASNCVELKEDGPVRKTWEIHKRHDPVAGGPPEDLSYLFTSVFFVSAYSGKNFVTVDHLL